MKKNVFVLAICAVLCMAFAACDDDEGSKKRTTNPYIPVLNGKMYYRGMATGVTTEDWELWATDGTAEGTAQVKDINTAAGEGSDPIIFGIFNNNVYFAAYNGSTGLELWKSDGTNIGTVMVKNINEEAVPGTGEGSNPDGLIIYKNKIYFQADDGIHGRELWVSDGTADGTVMVTDINTVESVPDTTDDSSPRYFTVYNGKIYFRADDGIHGRELWVSDGTAGGTDMVTDINTVVSVPDTTDSSSPAYLTVYDGKIFFRANDGIHGYELWVSDGTAGGTDMVTDINTVVSVPDTTDSSSPAYLTVYNGKLCFQANDGIHDDELWVSDGIVNGATGMLEINDSGDSNIWSFMEFEGNLYFSADDGTSGDELYVFDGDSVDNVADIYDSGNGTPCYMTAYKGDLFFQACDASNGCQLWVSDGIVGGTTEMIEALYPSNSWPFASYLAGSKAVESFIPCNGFMLFGAVNGDNDDVLWRSDGTPDGTIALPSYCFFPNLK